jgi:hypothetical protein
MFQKAPQSPPLAAKASTLRKTAPVSWLILVKIAMGMMAVATHGIGSKLL